MADKLPEMKDRKISEVLGRIDKDTELLTRLDADISKYAPPEIRGVLAVQPAEGLLGGMDSTAAVITAALEEIDKKRDALHANAEHGITRMKEWMTEFATQHAQLMQEMNELHGKVNESVERILDIGKRPIGNGNGNG